MKTSRIFHRSFIGVVGVLMLLAMGMVHQTTHSASLTSVSVTLSNSRPSFHGVQATNVIGTSEVNIVTSGPPSTSAQQLVEGDQVRLGTGGSMGLYTVTDVLSTSTFTVTPALASGHNSGSIISTQSAALTVRFTTANAIEDGSFRILVPAHTTNATSSDGIPDGGQFDYGATAPTVTCPGNTTGYTFSAPTSAASTVTIGSQDYHAFICGYTGVGGVGTIFDGGGGNAQPIIITSLINPAPDSGHTQGTADTYPVVIQHRDSGGTVADSTTVQIGVIEAVKVTASVDPQITFQISGVADNQSVCYGASPNTDVTTTPVEVPFGSLLISTFRRAAQELSVSTNASLGYSVTAVANDQLGRNGGVCAGDPTTNTDCIPDAIVPTNSPVMTHTAPATWADTSEKGFAYSLRVPTAGPTAAFEHNTNSGNCNGSNCYRQFADAEDGQLPVEIFSSTTPSDSHDVYVCYKAVISALQAAGRYENYITYTATARF